ncbi:MAG: MCE family protein [Oligoflexia bacterium]|nr:MCE family protein [Oligoflexia bacterium]
MEQSNGVEKKVGLFVAIATIAFIVIIFLLGGDKSFFKSYQYMKLKLEETSGLVAGNVVQMAGIASGNVESIELDAEGNHLIVNIKIDKKYAARLTKGTTASIRTQGALGDKYVLIKPGPPSGELLTENDFIESEEGADLLSTLGKSGSKFERVFEIIEHVNNITKDLDQGKFGKNLSDSTRSLKNTMSNIDDSLASKKIKKSLDHLASIMEKIDKGQGTLGGLINDPSVHEDLKAIMGGAKRSSLLKFLIRQTIQKGEEEEKKQKVEESKQ